MSMCVLAQDAGYHPDAQHDKRQADQSLRPVIQTFRQSQVHLQHCDAKRHHCEGMAQRIGHPKPQPAAPVFLYSCDIRNSGQMIVVKAVLEPQHKAGAEGGHQFPVAPDRCHRCSV